MRSRVRTSKALNQCKQAQVQADTDAMMLGASVGCSGRAIAKEEEDRSKAAKQVATRLAFLPLSLRSKALLASTVIAPKAAWGAVLSGRRLRAGESKVSGIVSAWRSRVSRGPG